MSRKNIYSNKKTISALFVFLLFFSLAFSCHAGMLNDDHKSIINSSKGMVSDAAGYDPSIDEYSLARFLGTAIKGFLSLLGIIFIILILYAGYNWMTAAGDESKVETAKKTLQRAIIGLVITVMAYGIWNFVYFALI